VVSIVFDLVPSEPSLNSGLNSGQVLLGRRESIRIVIFEVIDERIRGGRVISCWLVEISYASTYADDVIHIALVESSSYFGVDYVLWVLSTKASSLSVKD